MRRFGNGKLSGRLGLSMAFLAGLCLCLPLELAAVPSGDTGPPADKGRKKDDGGGVTLGDLYGDQWMIIRDVSAAGDGEPILFTWEWPPELIVEGDLVIGEGDLPLGYSITTEGCVQPFSFAPVTGLDPQFTYDSYVDTYGVEQTVYLIPLDAECSVPDVYAETWGTAVMEVDTGRLNVARSGQEVMDAAYEEVLATLNKALAITLDPAGRLMLVGMVEDDVVSDVIKTIDAPLENLALYQRILLDGCLSDTETLALTETTKTLLTDGGQGYLVCGIAEETVTNEDLLRAASFLAGSGDKTGRINTDLVVNLNSILGINRVVITESRHDSVQVTQYYDFGDFAYLRDVDDLTNRASLLQPTESGGDIYPGSFYVDEIAVMEQVFAAGWDSSALEENLPIINFTRAADDALGIIFYLHNFALPAYPVPLLP